jgi:K+-sensing histidine kinase KdpD
MFHSMKRHNVVRETSPQFRKAQRTKERRGDLYEIVRELAYAEERALASIRFQRFIDTLGHARASLALPRPTNRSRVEPA